MKTMPYEAQGQAEATATEPQDSRKESASASPGVLAVVAREGAPDSRTRSIWLTQLVLAAATVLMSVLVLALQPAQFGQWNFSVGVLVIVAVTMATLCVPWHRLRPNAALVVPFVDVVGIGLVASNTELRLSYFWVLPVMWVAMHFSLRALGAILATIGAILVIDVAANVTTNAVVRVIIVLLSLLFIGITAHLSLRQSRALRKLLTRQAARLNRTVDRRSEQERRTNEILNGVDTGVARISSSGVMIAYNSAYAALYGLDAFDSSLPAKSVEYDGLRGMPIATAQRPFTRAARGEVFSDARVWLYTSSGQWRVLSATSKRLEQTSNEGTSMLLLVHDVTAITHAQRERERLTAIATHELKHPLTVMIGNADLALERDDLDERTRARLESILEAGERMLEITDSMLRTSKSTFSAREAFDEIDLRQIVWDAVESFQPTAAKQQVALDVVADVPLPIMGDGFRMRQVVDNLISNAIKYTSAEGRVRIVAALDGPSASLVVSDTGIGIAKDDLAKIFTPYFRTEAAKKQAVGTGLGLNITREIVTAHGGSLTIDSAAGVGTSMEVRLPTASTAPVGGAA